MFANFNVLKGRPGRYGKPGLRGLPGLGVKGDKGEQGLRGLPGQVFVSQVASYDNLLFLPSTDLFIILLLTLV